MQHPRTSDIRSILRTRTRCPSSKRLQLDITPSSMDIGSHRTLRDVPNTAHHSLQGQQLRFPDHAPRPPACCNSLSDCYLPFFAFDSFISYTKMYPPSPVSFSHFRRRLDQWFRRRFFSVHVSPDSFVSPAPPRFHLYDFSTPSDCSTGPYEPNTSSCSSYITCTHWYSIL